MNNLQQVYLNTKNDFDILLLNIEDHVTVSISDNRNKNINIDDYIPYTYPAIVIISKREIEFPKDKQEFLILYKNDFE